MQRNGKGSLSKSESLQNQTNQTRLKTRQNKTKQNKAKQTKVCTFYGVSPKTIWQSRRQKLPILDCPHIYIPSDFEKPLDIVRRKIEKKCMNLCSLQALHLVLLIILLSNFLITQKDYGRIGKAPCLARVKSLYTSETLLHVFGKIHPSGEVTSFIANGESTKANNPNKFKTGENIHEIMQPI